MHRQKTKVFTKGRFKEATLNKNNNMSKRNDLKAAWRAIRANQAKQQMNKVNHLGVSNSKHFFTY